VGSVRQDARRRRKRCCELLPGTLEQNTSDGLVPSWWRTVLNVDSQLVSRCLAIDARGSAVSIVSNAHRGMWKTRLEP